MRLSRFSLLGVAVSAMVGCTEPSDEPTRPNTPPLAFVRYINAVPDTLSTTVRFIDQVAYSPITFANVAFRSVGQGNYQPTEAKARKLRVFTFSADVSAAGNTNILVDTTLTFEAGKYYTLLHLGYARPGSTPKQRLVVINDVLPATPAGIAFRAIHAGLDVGNVDIYATPTTTDVITGTPLLANVALNTVSAYLPRATGAFAARVTAAGSTTAVISAAAPAGTAGSASVDPLAGATIAGSIITAIAFPATPANSAGARFTTPGVVYYVDKQPPRTTPNP
ncbi:DUF4397 domain-containing protein [Gemmatimonas sp.]|uniref:DUF4397 domain-containing protein n=1 Tax=Gemmatimonas sp. TaxID=1962908 RepID=UPI00286CA444|nr:DUF4397 domain-containing protein [Gemmatimonas sp.]